MTRTREAVDGRAAELEALLSAYGAAHERMLALTGEQRAAVSRADAAGVSRATLALGAVLRDLQELDARRRAFAARMGVLPPRGGAEPTMTDLARLLPDGDRARVLAAAARVRETAAALRRDAGTLRVATRSLLGHVEGVMQRVAGALDRARVYGPRGTLSVGGSSGHAACGVDLVR